MTTTRYYISSDAGAPPINSTQGSYAAVLRACLVAGYGSGGSAKTGAGWTEPFAASGNIAVFQNSTAAGGTGCYVQIDETGTSSAGPVKLTVYQSMSSLTDGTNPTNSYLAYRLPAATAKPSTWHVCADELTFYFSIAQPDSAAAVNIYPFTAGAGDIASFSTADAYRYFCLGPMGSFQPIFANGGFTSTSDIGLSLGREYTGIVSGYSPHSLLGITAANGAIFGDDGYPITPSLNGANNYVMPALVVRNNVVRGKLRGISIPLFHCGIDFDSSTGHSAYNENTSFAFPGGSNLSLFSLYKGSSSKAHGGVLIEQSLSW